MLKKMITRTLFDNLISSRTEIEENDDATLSEWLKRFWWNVQDATTTVQHLAIETTVSSAVSLSKMCDDPGINKDDFNAKVLEIDSFLGHLRKFQTLTMKHDKVTKKRFENKL